MRCAPPAECTDAAGLAAGDTDADEPAAVCTADLGKVAGSSGRRCCDAAKAARGDRDFNDVGVRSRPAARIGKAGAGETMLPPSGLSPCVALAGAGGPMTARQSTDRQTTARPTTEKRRAAGREALSPCCLGEVCFSTRIGRRRSIRGIRGAAMA